MSQKTVYAQNSHKLVDNSYKSQIFGYLLKNKKRGVTQKQLTEKFNLSQGRVSILLKEIGMKPYPHRKKTYKLTYREGRYRVEINDEDVKINDNRFYIQENSFDDRFEQELEKLSNPKIWVNPCAERVTSTVILYGINSYHRMRVADSLTKLFGTNIHAIIPCPSGVYIILKEDSNTKDTSRSIIDFYIKGYNKSHNIK